MSLLGTYAKEMKAYVHKKTQTGIFLAPLFTVVHHQKQPNIH